MNTIDYLYKNDLNITTGIHFTIRDLIWHSNNPDEEVLVINGNKSTKEKHTKKDTVNRLNDLYKLAVSEQVCLGETSVFDSSEKYLNNLTDVYRELEEDFNVIFDALENLK